MTQQTVTLDEACLVITDGTHYTPKAQETGRLFLTVKDMLDGRLDFKTCSRISEADFQNAARNGCCPQTGDVLFSKDGTVGKVHPFASEEDCAVLSSVVILRPRREVLDQGYFAHFLRSDRFLKKALRNKTGSAIRRIILANLRNLEIPLPPLVEQRRIAAILDKANDIQCRQQEASNMIQAVPTSLFLTLFGDPRVNSRSWPEHSLGELGRVVTGATPPSSEQGMFDGPVPFITPGDLGSGKEAKRSLSESGSLKSRTVKCGSALVCCIGVTIGKMDIAKRDSAFNQQINAVEWGDSIIGEYGIEALRFFSRNIAKAGASTTLPILKKSSFEKLRLPVPPVELQYEYGRQLEAIYAHSGSLHQALQIAASLKQSLMSRAFIGEL
jgi:restriction endonuclease S subunit